MDQNELFTACRLGNLEKLQFLVEERDIELNVRDMWDSTPLYYACLCGHKELVEYLLEHGARCEADTFDGERALYGALTAEIKQLLLHHKAITSQTIRRNQYEEFLRVMWENQDKRYSDITFDVHGEEFNSHRCILAARSHYFRNHFASKWRDRRVIINKHPLVDAAAFKAIMHYTYTGRLEIHVALVDDCIRLARQFDLADLVERLERQNKDARFFVKTKFGKTRISTLVIEPRAGFHELHRDLGKLALQALPPGTCQWLCGYVDDDTDDESELWDHLTDVIFVVKGERFRCHKTFFCQRSEFFEAITNDPFHESTLDKSGIPMIVLHDISIETFAAVVFYVYQDFAEISPENVMDVLYIAELYLLPGLKKLCGTVIAEKLEEHNVVGLLRTARQLQLPRLQTACVEFMACNLETIINSADLRALVIEDAQEVKERQETDTIDVIDDIRYSITSNVQTYSQTAEAHERLVLIDNLLEELGLDA